MPEEKIIHLHDHLNHILEKGLANSKRHAIDGVALDISYQQLQIVAFFVRCGSCDEPYADKWIVPRRRWCFPPDELELKRTVDNGGQPTWAVKASTDPVTAAIAAGWIHITIDGEKKLLCRNCQLKTTVLSEAINRARIEAGE